jgi:hypothetical protein
LDPVPDLHAELSFASDSTGVDDEWNVEVFAITIEIVLNGLAGTLDAQAYCQPRVGLRAIYRIPKTDACVGVVSFAGRPYGCEEVERLILLRAASGS